MRITQLTTKQAARVLRQSPAAVRMAILRHKLKAGRHGMAHVISTDELRDYIVNGKRQYDKRVARMLDVL
jgi:hypothetical protein